MKTIIIAVLVLAVLVGGFFLLNSYIYSEKQGEQGFQKGYKDTTYEIEGEPIALTNGVWEETEEVAPGIEETRRAAYFGNEAEGDLNGDGVSDIAFILTYNGGGSGTFVYAVAALKTDSGYAGTNGILLGDRVAPQSTEIRDGVLTVNYADRKPDEPMSTAPSVGRSLELRVADGRLIFAREVVP